MRLDSQRTFPTVRVTGISGSRFSYGYLSLNTGTGSSSRFELSQHINDQGYLELRCLETNDDHTCDILCHNFPNSYLCPRTLGKIIVTTKRKEPPDSYGRFNIKPGKVVLVSSPTEDDEAEARQQKKERKELEEKCEKELNDLFTPKEDFPFAAAFGLKPSADETEKIDEYLDQLIRLTAPIMTTGVEGYNNGKPVDYEKGLEAHNAFYIDSNGNLTRGKNLTFGTLPGLIEPKFREDTQFQQMLDSPNTQSLKVDFHTHPSTKKYYVLPSSRDIAKFITDKRYKFVDKHALLAIGFMSSNKYSLLLMSLNDNQVLFEKARTHAQPDPRVTLDKIAHIKEYGEIIELLFKNSKMLIVELNDNKVEISDYFEFFEDNPLNQKVGDTRIIPESCSELLKANKQ